MKSIFSIILAFSILFSNFPSEIFHHHHDEEKDVCHLEHHAEDFSCCEHFDHGKLPDDPHIHSGFIDCDFCKFLSKDNRTWTSFPSLKEDQSKGEITFYATITEGSSSAIVQTLFLRGPPSFS